MWCLSLQPQQYPPHPHYLPPPIGGPAGLQGNLDRFLLWLNQCSLRWLTRWSDGRWKSSCCAAWLRDWTGQLEAGTGKYLSVKQSVCRMANEPYVAVATVGCRLRWGSSFGSVNAPRCPPHAHRSSRDVGRCITVLRLRWLLSANNQSFKAHFSLLMMMMMMISIAKSMLVFALLMTVCIPEMVYHLCLLL